MSSTNCCPECGANVPADAPRGLCPRCLIAAATATATHRPAPPGPKEGDAVPPASTTVDLSEFVGFVRELDLVAAGDLDGLAGGALGDAARLARALVQAGMLTAYQAGALLQGKARGLLIGRYLVLSKLGVGGMGVVFKARHRPSGREVALKMLPPSFGRDPNAVRRFRREFEVASGLNHPNLVAVIEAGEDRGVHFLAMDFIGGYDLERLVTEGGPLEIKLALHCAIQAARGLEVAHSQGIVHRDIKPGNVMIDAAGLVRVLDLGLARVIEATSQFGRTAEGSLTQTGAYMGTVDFLAPEQADDAKRADHRADIYGLGCTLYYLLTARPPFEGDTVLKRLMAHQQRPAPSLRDARPEVSAAIEEIYLRMMAKRPADRPQSMSEVVLALEACRSSAREAGDASADLKTFARTVMKRAAPRGRRSADSSVFARPAKSPDGLQFDPDLRLEDLISDYREEMPLKPLPDEKLPPIAYVPQPPRRRRRRSTAPYALLGVGLLALAFAVYSHRPNPSPARPSPSPSPAPAIAHVPPPTRRAPASRPVKPPEFLPLFNGRNLDGWAGDVADYEVVGGILSGKPGRQAVLYQPVERGDFAARVEFRLAPGAEGGIMVRYPGSGDAAYDGMCEIQILDDSHPMYANIDARCYNGSCWGLVAAKPGSLKGPGEWNAQEVTVRGSTVKVVLNGTLILDADLAPIRDSHNGKPHPGKSRTSGYFGIQSGPGAGQGSVQYRKIEIQDLGGPKSSPGGEEPRRGKLILTDDFSDQTSGWPADTVAEAARQAEHHKGYADGMYRLDANAPGFHSWHSNLEFDDIYCEARARVFGDRPESRGSALIEIVRVGSGKGFQVRLTNQGEVFLEPSFRTVANQPDAPKVGPIRHPAIRAGSQDAFTKIGIRKFGRSVEVFVNGSRVVGPIELDWEGPAGLLLGVAAEVPNVRAEFDRLDVWSDSVRDYSPGTTPVDAVGRKLNLDFETGTFQDWTAEGDAFAGQPIEGDTVHARRNDMRSGHQGKYWVGTYEKAGDRAQGTLTSAPFRVAQPFASFLVSGGALDSTCVEVVRKDDGRVIATRWGRRTEDLNPVSVDLRRHLGEEIFIRVVDHHGEVDDWTHINFDDFRFHPDPTGR